jgi:hypothetical protein
MAGASTRRRRIEVRERKRIADAMRQRKCGGYGWRRWKVNNTRITAEVEGVLCAPWRTSCLVGVCELTARGTITIICLTVELTKSLLPRAISAG